VFRARVEVSEFYPHIEERKDGFHNRMRFIDKHLTSPFLHKFAGSARSPFAVIQHVDAASGNLSRSLIIVEPMGSGFLLALPDGPNAEWYCEILAAGHCTLRWHGRIYELDRPKPVDAKTALRAFPLPVRLILRARATKHFRMMTAQITQN
jgi:hypothetical protein